VRNVQIRTPRGSLPVDDLAGKMDLVLIDAPCSGSGTWRRNPDAKWRMRPNSLADRIKDQANVLQQGGKAVKPGGRLVYITCSVLRRRTTARSRRSAQPGRVHGNQAGRGAGGGRSGRARPACLAARPRCPAHAATDRDGRVFRRCAEA